jgi:hypothetical protein
MCDKIDNVDESLVLSKASGLESFWNPFDHLKNRFFLLSVSKSEY